MMKEVQRKRVACSNLTWILLSLSFTACSGGSRVAVTTAGPSTVVTPAAQSADQVRIALSTAQNKKQLQDLNDAFKAASGNSSQQQQIAKQMIQTVLAEARKDEEADILGEVVDLLSDSEWDDVGASVLKSDKPDLALELLRFEDRHGHMLKFIDQVSSPILAGDESFLKQAVQQFKYSGVTEILSHLTHDQIHNLNSVDAKNLLTNTAQVFDPNSGSGQAADRWDEAMTALRDLRKMERDIDSVVSATDGLVWLEQLHHKLQDDFAKDRQSAKHYLGEQPATDLDTNWLKFAVMGRESALANGIQLSDISLNGKLDQILLSRLKAIYEDSPKTRKKLLNSFCALLTSDGVVSKKVSVQDAQNNLAALLVPGCHRIDYPKTGSTTLPVLKLDQQKILMSPDSAFIAPDVDLTIHAQYFEGAFIDLSSEQTPAPMASPAPATPDMDAIAFPIMIGFQVKGQTGNSFPQNKMYYFMASDPFRSAMNGASAAAVKLVQGFRGGNLQLQTDDANSILPTLVSIGGMGQKAAAPAQGGKTSTSAFDLTALESFFSIYKAEHQAEWVKDGSPGELADVEGPSVLMLKDILAAATRENDAVKVFIPDDYLYKLQTSTVHALNEQGQKVKTVCAAAGMLGKLPSGDPDFQPCFEKLIAPQFFNRLQNDLNEKQLGSQLQDILDYFRLDKLAPGTGLVTYAEPAGNPGEQAKDGLNGDDGSFSWNQDLTDSEAH